MLYALDQSGKKKITARPGLMGYCPLCDNELIPRCGEINIHHWAHKKDADCDPWYESETDWHLAQKSVVPADWVEVTIKKDGEKHRADILRPDGLVIELQHSPISVYDIGEREYFYKKIRWLFDIRDCRNNGKKVVWANGSFPDIDDYSDFEEWFIDATNAETITVPDHRFTYYSREGHYTFKWKYPRKYIGYASNVLLDLGDNQIFVVKKMYNDAPAKGWGYLRAKVLFVHWLQMNIKRDLF